MDISIYESENSLPGLVFFVFYRIISTERMSQAAGRQFPGWGPTLSTSVLTFNTTLTTVHFSTLKDFCRDSQHLLDQEKTYLRSIFLQAKTGTLPFYFNGPFSTLTFASMISQNSSCLGMIS